ncbi:MAG: hypothetical protein ACK55Z_20835, partial [bacterium]
QSYFGATSQAYFTPRREGRERGLGRERGYTSTELQQDGSSALARLDPSAPLVLSLPPLHPRRIDRSGARLNLP